MLSLVIRTINDHERHPAMPSSHEALYGVRDMARAVLTGKAR